MVKYPSYIHVVKLRDLFWNNNSDLYPTTAPSLGLYTRKNKTRPVFHNPYTATLVLEGDFNHAFYGGRYFFLSKLEVLDVERQKYRYQMDMDVVLNFMTVGSGGRVKGTIVRTNREEFLREAIQTTVPVISDPTDIYVFNTETKEGEEVEWQRSAVRLADVEATIRNAGARDFVEPCVSVDDWVFFTQRVKTNFIGIKTKGKTWLPGTYSTVYYNPHQHTNPLFVMDYLPVRFATSSWKVEALGYVVSFLTKQLLWAEKKFLEEQTKDQTAVATKLKQTMKGLSDLWKTRSEVPLSNETHRKFVITKQNKVAGHFNDGQFVVSLENEAAGDSVEDGVYVERIDLSGLTDIVPLNNRGERKEPDTTPNIKKHLVTIPGGAMAVDQYFYRLERKAYLPINTVYDRAETKRCIRTRVSGNFDLCSVSNIKNQPPQRVTFKENFRSRVGGSTGNLWFLNKNNFSIVSYDGKLKGMEWSKLPTGERDILRPYVELSNANVLSGHWYWWFYYDHKYTQLLPLGFMMYLIDRDPNSWNDFEYLGDQPLTQVSYINNIKQSAVDKYEGDKHNWKLGTFDTNNLLGLNEFQKYWLLELDRMTWLTLIPTQKGLNYKWIDTDEFGVWNYYPDASWNDWQYIARLPHMPIKKINETLVAPYGRDSIDTYVRGRYAQLKKIINWGVFKPTNPIKKGDIFTTSVEHELQEVDILYNLPFDLTAEEKFEILNHKYQFDQARKQKLLPGGYVAPMVKPPSTTAEDYIFLGFFGAIPGLVRGYGYEKWQAAPLGDQVKYSSPVMDGMLHRRPVNITTPFDTLILYLYKGTYRLGILEITPGQEFRVNEEGILDAVEGTKSTKVQTIQISNIDQGVVDYKQGEDDRFNEGVQQEAFREVMTRIRNSTNDRIFHYSSEDFRTLDLTFDLVGTDWYLLMVKGTVHLIPKPRTNLIKEKAQDQKTKKIPVNIPESIDTFSKINQRSEFVVLGQSIPLNVRFSGGSESCLLYRQTELTPEGDDGMSYYNLWATTEADTIDTWITIPKKKTRSVENTDSTQSFIIREKLSNLPLEYELDKLKSRLFFDTKQELLARQREDLSWQREDAMWNLAFKGTQIVGSSIAGVAGASALAGAAGAMGGRGALAMGAGAAGSVAGAAGSLYGSVQFLLRYPTLLERVNADERNLILDTTQQLFQRKQNYENNFAIQTLKLNKGVNSFIKPTISNRDVQEKSNKARKIKDINVHLYLPNTTQRREIAHIYSTFGCECVYESDFIPIVNNMDPILVKFSKIASGDILSELTTDLNLRDILIQLLENGVKFEQTIHEAIPQEYEGDLTPHRSVDLAFDIENIPQWSREKWDIFRVKKPKEEVIKAIRALDKYGLTPEEFSKFEANIRTDDDDNLLDDITRVIGGRTEGSVVEFPIPPELESIKLTQQLREKEAELATCSREKEALNTTIRNLNTAKADLEEELRQCKINITNLNQAKNTCDLISARKIKELEEKIKEKDIEIQAAQRGLTASVTRADTLSDQYKRLEQQKKQADNLATLYRQEADGLKKDKATLTSQITEKTNKVKELEKKIEKLEEDKDLIEGEKAVIDQQLKECLGKPASSPADTARIQKLQNQLQACKNANTTQATRYRNQITELTNTRSNIQREKKEIETAKKALEAAKAGLELEVSNLKAQLVNAEKVRGVNVPFNLCEVLKKMSRSSLYVIDTKGRNNGFSTFTDLCFELAQAIRWLRRTDTESYLGKYKPMQRVFELIQDLERVPVIDKCEDVIGFKGWSGFVQYMGDTPLPEVLSQDMKKIKEATDEIIDPEKLSSLPSIHSLWDVLDELNYAVYLAHAELKEEIKKDRDLETFFTHAIPGQRIKALYELLFQTPIEVSTIKKTLLTVPCPADGESQQNIIEHIQTVLESVRHEDIPPTLPQLEDGYVLNTGDVYPFLFYIDPVFIDPGRPVDQAMQPFNGFIKQHNPQLPLTFLNVEPSFFLPPDLYDVKAQYTIDGKVYRKSGYSQITLTTREELTDITKYRNLKTFKSRVRLYQEKETEEMVNEIMNARNRIWGERHTITLPQEVEEGIKKGSLYRQIAVRNWDIIERRYKDEQMNVDLVKVFGRAGARDAILLLAILDAFKQWWEPIAKQDNDFLLCNYVYRSSVDTIQSFINPKEREWVVVGENEFLNGRSVMNYLLNHIRHQPDKLINTLTNIPEKNIFK